MLFIFLSSFEKGCFNLLQAAYIINGNCKNVMNMSQPDQLEFWRSVSKCKVAYCETT